MISIAMFLKLFSEILFSETKPVNQSINAKKKEERLLKSHSTA